MTDRSVNKQSGFTLIEVLAALLVFSVAIIGLTQAGTQSTRAVSAIDEKMIAGIIADNQLILARHKPVEIGTESGNVTSMSRPFEYVLETERTDTAGFYRLIVKVRAAGREQILTERSAFVAAKVSS